MHRIKLPERTYENFGDPIVHLYQAASLAGDSPTGFTIDCSGSKHLSPILLCGLAVLVRRHRERGLSASSDPTCRNTELRAYLDEIRFPDGLAGDWNDERNRNAIKAVTNRRFTPLVSFAADMRPNMERDEFLQGIENELIGKCRLVGQMSAVMKYLLSEITGNIFYHAGEGTGFMVAQYDANNRYLDIAIADTGRGLRATYIKSGKHAPANDTEALRLALEGRSAKAELHRGFGIRTSRRMVVKGLGGHFLLWSGSAMLIDNTTGASIAELTDGTSLPGCFFALRIPTVAPSSFTMTDYYE
jgi:hypothetical protein